MTREIRPTVIDLATVRRARLSKFCRHVHAEIDGDARVLQCIECKAQLDPFEFLARLAHEGDWIASLDAEHRKLTERVEEAKAIVARLRGAARKAAEREPVVAELRRLKQRIARHLRDHPDVAVQAARAELRQGLGLLVDATVARISQGEDT